MYLARACDRMSLRAACGGLLLIGALPAVCVTNARAEECSDHPGHYCKLANPPDVEKDGGPGSDLTCWLATAANMLAGAGYGTDGNTVQERAEEIYGQLKAEFGTLE